MADANESRPMQLTRRDVLRLGGALIAGSALAACAGPKPAPTAVPPTKAPEPTKAAAAQPTAVPATKVPEPAKVQPTPPPTSAPVAAGAQCTPNTGLDDIKKLVDAKTEMTGWAPAFNPNVPDMTSWNEQVFFKKMTELTNVNIKWEHGSPDPQINALALVMASGNLPDLITMGYFDMNDYALEGALEPIDPYLDKLVWFPKLLKERPSLRAFITAADGKMYHWPRCQQDQRLQAWTGFAVRQDLLDAVKLPIPQTTDQLYEVLKAFKKNDPKIIPTTGNPRNLIWSWGVGSACYAGQSLADYFVEDGKVKYGPLEPGWREAMVFLNRLFKEELLDPEFATRMGGNDKENERQASGLVGFAMPSSIYGWTAIQSTWDKESGNTKKWVHIHPPKGPRGHQQNPTIQAVSNYQTGGVMSKKAKNKELLARFIDQYYSPAGSQLMFWGTCGDTWSYNKAGKMEYSGRYVGAKVQGAAFVRNYLGPQGTGPMLVNAEALGAWAGGFGSVTIQRRLFWAEESNSMMLPDAMPLTKAEKNAYKARMGDIGTLINEHWVQFITGQKSVEKDYDGFIAKLKSLGIEEAIKILQGGYDKFQAALKQA